MKYLLCLATLCCVAISPLRAQGPFTGKPQYQIEVRRADTVMGKIIVEMFPAIAPMSVRNWDSLVGIHFYDGTAFHRVIPGFMIQGGDPNSIDGDPSTWGYGDPSQQTIDAEFSAVSHRRGILSAARASDPNSATSQFFICVGNPTYLDRNYSVYGHVVSGMNVADSIVMAPRDTSQQRNRPWEKISMYITRLGSNDSVTPMPIGIMPPQNFMSTSPRVRFQWPLIAGAMMYDLQIATDSLFTNIVIDTTFNQIQSSASIVNVFGTYYWRLQANNGGIPSAYSPVSKFTVQSLRVGEDEADQSISETLFPNPTKDDARLLVELTASAQVHIALQDAIGRIVFTTSIRGTAGPNEIELPTKSLPSGVYVCRTECEGHIAVRKLIVE